MKRSLIFNLVMALLMLFFVSCERQFGLPVDQQENSELWSKLEGWWMSPLENNAWGYETIEEAIEAANTIDFKTANSALLYAYYKSDGKQICDEYHYVATDLFSGLLFGQYYEVVFKKDKGVFVDVGVNKRQGGRANYIADINDDTYITGKSGNYHILKKVENPFNLAVSAYNVVKPLNGTHTLILTKKTIKNGVNVVSEIEYEDKYPSVVLDAQFYNEWTPYNIEAPHVYNIFLKLGSFTQTNGFVNEHREFINVSIGYCYYGIGDLFATINGKDPIVPYSRCKIVSLDESLLVLLCEKPETTELTELVFSVVE